MPEKARVTIRDIARVAGLSKSSVSLALRNSPSLPKATRDKIHAVAAEMGYRPDPTLAALAHYRYGNSPAGAPVLAWLSNWPSRTDWQNEPWGEHFVGARHQADRLGYKLEHFWLREPKVTIARLEQMFRTRNIRGLIVAPQPMSHPPLPLSWPNYAAVSIGYSLKFPALHTVASFHFRSMGLALSKLRELGYRKIGFAVSDAGNERNEHALRAAFLAESTQNQIQTIPPLLLQGLQKSLFIEWFRENNPDVVVTVGQRVASAIRKWWSEIGIAIPEDVGLVLLSDVPLDSEITGIHEHLDQIGATAVNVLAGLLHHNVLGLPDFPTCTMIEGSWVEGRSVRVMGTKGR